MPQYITGMTYLIPIIMQNADSITTLRTCQNLELV